MNIYASVAKAFLNHKFYMEHYHQLNLQVINKDLPEWAIIFKSFPTLHETGIDKIYTPLDLKVAVMTNYPKINEESLDLTLEMIKGPEIDYDVCVGFLRSIHIRSTALEHARIAVDVVEGRKEFEELSKHLSGVSIDVAKQQQNCIIDDDLEQLVLKHKQEQGFRWRLMSMNKHLGSLRKGDFGFVFARPESGKTSFLASECTFFATQLPEEAGPILWINNEEVGSKVMLRCYQAALGRQVQELLNAPSKFKKDYYDATHGKLKIIDLKPTYKKEVEALCNELQPSIIVFDQIDKIEGFSADRNDLELKQVYGWARNLASQYGPVIAVCQAGGTGEDKPYLTMNDVDSSKTSKQGEADWILGIGTVSDFGKEQVRYLHLSKNKLFGDEDSDPTMRHAKWSVFFEFDIALYKDFNRDGTIKND